MAKKKKQTEQKPLTQADIQKVMEIAKNDISNSTSVDGNFSISNSNSATINPNTQSTPLTDTQLQARQYIQSIYDSNASVPTSNNNEIPSLKDNYVQGSNPNIPDEDARMKARDYINNVMNGKINEDGTLNEQKKQTKIQSPSKNTKKNSENVFDTIGKNGAKAFNKAKDLAKDIVPSSVEKKNPTTSEEKNNLVVDKSNNTIPTLSAKDQNRILYDVQNYNLANNKPITKEGTQEKPNFHRASANDAKNKTTKAEGGSGGSTYIGETTPESVVKTNEKYANPDVQRTGTWGKTRKDLENAQKYAEEFEKKYNLDFNPSTMGATETEKQKEQELINSGVVTQEQLDAMRNVGFYNSAEENVGSAIVNFGSSLAKPFTAIGGLFSDSMKEADKSRAEAEEYAQKVAPKSSMVGQFAGNTVLYSGANEILGGANEGVSLLGRIGRGQAADTVLDTIPTIASNINQGEYTDENGNFNTSALIKDIVENQATNLAFNLGAEGLEEIGKRASKKNANAIPTVENNALVNNADSLKNLENNVANNLVEPTENIVKNADNDLATRYARTVGAENDANYVKQLREDFESGNTYDYLENMNKYIKENPDNLAEEVLNENRIIRDELYDRAIIDANGNVKYGEYALSDANDVKNLRDSLANSPMRNSLAEADALNYEENIRALDRWLEKHNYTEVPQNVPQMAENVSQVPQNVAKPKVEYNTKNVEGFTRMDSNLTSMQKMFGDSTTEPKVAQMKALLNEYATTGNIEAYNQAKQIADELDGYLKGSKYNTKKGRTIKYGDTDTFSFEVENSANAMNNMASVRSVDIPGHEELNSKIDNLVADFGANDDSSKIAIELKQSINDLANDTSVDNLRAVQQKTQDLYYSLENSEKLTNAYRNKTQKFGYDDIKEIADETEQIYKDSVTDYRGNKAEYKPIENVADTKPINNTEDSVPTKPLSDQVNDIGEVKPTDENVLNPEEAYAKGRTNSLENSGLNTKEELESEYLDKENFKYIKTHEEETMREAMENFIKDREGNLESLMKKPIENISEVDIDSLMIHYRELIKEARATGDEQYYALARDVFKKVQESTTRSGKVVQALAKWSRNTVEGKMVQAEKLITDITDKIHSSVKNEFGNKDFSEKFNKFIDELKTKVDSGASEEEIANLFRKNENIFGNNNVIVKGKNYFIKGLSEGKNFDELVYGLKDRNKVGYITNEDFKTILNNLELAETMEQGSREQQRLLAKTAKLAMKNTPVTMGTKARNVLYFNMLANIKTSVSKNAGGNSIYNVLESIRKQTIGPAVDKVVGLKTGKRTEIPSLTKAKAYGEGFKKGALEQIDDIRHNLDTGRSGQDSWEYLLGDSKPKIENKANTKVGKKVKQVANDILHQAERLMKLGDRPYYEAAYAETYQEFKQIVEKYGKESTIARAVPDEYLDDFIKLYSMNNALSNVFQDKTKIASGLSNVRKGLSELSQGVVSSDLLSMTTSPFILTPGNMASKALEYSPLGVVKNGIDTYRELKNGAFNQRRFTDETSRNILGTAGLIGTYEMAKNNLMTGSYSDNSNIRKQQQNDGYIEYAPIINGFQYDASDIPVIGPLLQAGARFNESLNEGDSTTDALTKGTGQILESVIGSSMMQGFNRILGGESKYDTSGNGVLDNVANTVKSSGSMLVPSLARQFAQYSDDYKRDLGEYMSDEYYMNLINNSIPGDWSAEDIPILNQIPFFKNLKGREALPIKYDNEGKPVEMNQGRKGVEKALETFVYPMNRSKYNPSETTQEAQRLAEETLKSPEFDGEADTSAVIPNPSRSDYRKEMEKYDNVEATEEGYRAYKRILGETSSKFAKALRNSDYYDDLSTSQKLDAYKEIYSAAKAIALDDMTGGQKAEKMKNGLAKTYIESKGDKETFLNAVKDIIDNKATKSGLEEMGIPVNDVTKEAYANNKQGTLNAWKKANAKAQEYGLESISTSQYKKYDECSSRDKDKYLEYIAEIKKTGSESSADGTKEGFEAYKNGTYGTYIKEKNAKEERANDDVSKALQSLSVYSTETRNRYDNAKKEIPSLKPREYANTVRKIDTNKNGVSQDELIAYFNKNNVSQSEATKMWKAYGKSDWKSVPVLQGKTYKKKKK